MQGSRISQGQGASSIHVDVTMFYYATDAGILANQTVNDIQCTEQSALFVPSP